MKRRFAGVKRKTEFSPNHVGNDLQIILRTADALRRLGHEVDLYNEGDEIPEGSVYDLIFSMAQGPDGNHLLQKVARRGVSIINPPESVMNCYRTTMVVRLPAKGIPFPRSYVVETNPAVGIVPFGSESAKVWVKRGDVHAVHKEDVTLTYSDWERRTILDEFYRRGIRYAITQEHLEGDTVKFYAIRETDFFSWYYLNGVHHTPFEMGALVRLADSSAGALGLTIYGGDAIIAADGSISIIDINDWPSFAPVREAASRSIAALLIRKVEEHAHHFA